VLCGLFGASAPKGATGAFGLKMAPARVKMMSFKGPKGGPPGEEAPAKKLPEIFSLLIRLVIIPNKVGLFA